MRKNFGAQTILYPMPVFIIATYNEDGTPNAMNAAWGGIHDTNQIGICIAPDHKTAKNTSFLAITSELFQATMSRTNLPRPDSTQ